MIQRTHYILPAALALMVVAILPMILFAQTEENGTLDTATGTISNSTSSIPSRPGERPEDRNQRNETPRSNPIIKPGTAVEPRTNLRSSATLEQRQNQMEARRVEIQSNQATQRALLQEKAQTRITNLAANISNRMEAAIRRLSQVIDRIDSRVLKLKDAEVDTTEAERLIGLAKTDITSAITTLSTIDTVVVTAVTSNNPRANWADVRTTYETARNQIKSAHSNIKKSVEALKIAIRSSESTEQGVSEAVKMSE